MDFTFEDAEALSSLVSSQEARVDEKRRSVRSLLPDDSASRFFNCCREMQFSFPPFMKFSGALNLQVAGVDDPQAGWLQQSCEATEIFERGVSVRRLPIQKKKHGPLSVLPPSQNKYNSRTNHTKQC